MRSYYAAAAILLAMGGPALALTVGIWQPYATRRVVYSGQALVGGGTAPYTFSVPPGSLPPGLQMDSTGALSGTPTHAGTYTFTITATANNLSDSGSASIIVAGTTLTMSPAIVPPGHVGLPYSPFTVAVTGGVAPYTVSVTRPPPPGMTFDSVALSLSGTPATGGNYSLELFLSDSAGDGSGAVIATDAISLAANGHLAFTLATDKYPATANIRGTIEFDTPAGTQIGALGIRIPVAHTFTTLPALAK